MAPINDHRLVKRDAYELGRKARSSWEWLWDKMEKFAEGWKAGGPTTTPASVSVAKREATLTGKELQEMVQWEEYKREFERNRGPFFNHQQVPSMRITATNGQLEAFDVPAVN